MPIHITATSDHLLSVVGITSGKLKQLLYVLILMLQFYRCSSWCSSVDIEFLLCGYCLF